MKKQLLKSVLSALLVALIAVTVLTGCYGNNENPGQDNTGIVSQAQPEVSASEPDAAEIGEGNTVFVFEVTDNKGEVTRFNVSTDEETVGGALLKIGLIEGEESSYGLYVKTVNGLTADYDTDKAYWAFYVNGKYAVSGADATNIEPNTTYAFVYTKE